MGKPKPYAAYDVAMQDADLPPGLAEAQSRAGAVPAWIRVPIIVLTLGGAAYQMVAGVGIAGWLMSAQAAVFDGKYYVVVTGLLTLVIMLVPAVILVQLLAGLFDRA